MGACRCVGPHFWVLGRRGIGGVFGFEDIKRGAAVHAAPPLGKHDIKYGCSAVIQRSYLIGLLVLMGKIVEEGRALAQRACGLTPFEVGNGP